MSRPDYRESQLVCENSRLWPNHAPYNAIFKLIQAVSPRTFPCQSGEGGFLYREKNVKILRYATQDT